MRTCMCLTLLLAVAAVALCSERDDAFLAGYVSRVLDETKGIRFSSVTALDGVVTVTLESGGAAEAATVTNILSAVDGVSDVKVVLAETVAPDKTQIVREKPYRRRTLFEPLRADPRWPHFGASWLYYVADNEIANAGATSFGETFPIRRARMDNGDEWELALQAGVFAIFDLDAASKDLVNADYRVGIPVTWRRDRLSVLGRVYHQSSHLGDEFLLRNRVERVNLSYETVDVLINWNANEALRLYGGGGYIFHKDPRDIEPWMTQYGVEITGPELGKVTNRVARLVAAADLQNHQETQWRTNLSIRAGIQFDRPRDEAGVWQVLAEYYNGNSPNGQFFARVIEYVGLGVHYNF